MINQDSHPTPVVQITVDGLSIDSLIRRRLINLTHTDNRGFEADTVELELDDTDGQLDLPGRGAIITLALGWAASGLVSKGSFTVDEVAHHGAPDTLSIRARSADLRAGLTTQRERSWHATTLGAIVATIADENGLQASIPPSLSQLTIDHIDQTNETAANLLTRLGQQFDAIATVKDGRLLFIPASGGVSASGKRLPAVTLTRRSGDRHSFQIADRQTYTTVRALYNDIGAAVKGQVLWGTTEDSAERKQQPAVAAAPTAGQYKTLPTLYVTRAKAHRAAVKQWKALKANKAQRAAYIGVKAKYNDRNLSASGEVTYGQADDEKQKTHAQRQADKDNGKTPAKRQANKDNGKTTTANAFEHSLDNTKTLRHVYSSKANAQRAARAEWRRLQRGMATFSITLAQGLPELFPETPATVTGFKPAIDNTDWIIIKVTNSISDSGYIQMLELEIKATEIPD